MIFQRSGFIAVIVFLCSASALAEAPKIRFSRGGPKNLGVLINNEKHTIYRSTALGSSGLSQVSIYLKQKKLPFPKTIIYMNVDGYRRTLVHPTLYALEEYKDRLKYGYEFYHPFHPDKSTYLAGFNPYEELENVNLKKHLGSEALDAFGFQSQQVIQGDMDSFYRILDIVLSSEGPVLFHCTAGRHRTGMIALAIRYLQGGAWREGSYTGGFTSLIMNAAQYEYYLHNTWDIRTDNLDFIERWAQDPRFAEYQERYQASLNLPSLVQ